MTNVWFDIAEVSVGQHWYWQIGEYQVHGQVLITSWIVLGAIGLISLLRKSKFKINSGRSSKFHRIYY